MPALGCCGPDEGRYVALFTPPELYRTNVSMRSKRKSQVCWCHTVFFLPSGFFCPQSCLNFFFSSSFLLVEPLSSFAMTASRRGEHCFGGVWQSKNAFPFPLLSADSEQWRGVPGSCPLCRARTSCPDRTRLPDKQNTLSAYEFCTLASSGRPFSKLCYCHFSFDVQSWAGVGPDCFYSQEPGR